MQSKPRQFELSYEMEHCAFLESSFRHGVFLLLSVFLTDKFASSSFISTVKQIRQKIQMSFVDVKNPYAVWFLSTFQMYNKIYLQQKKSLHMFLCNSRQNNEQC